MYKHSLLLIAISLFFLTSQAQTKVETKNNLQPVSLYGFLYPKDGHASELKQALISLIEPTRQEEGSVVYNIHENKDGSFFIYEVWRSQVDFDQHIAQPFVIDFMSKVDKLIAKDIEAYSGQLLANPDQ